MRKYVLSLFSLLLIIPAFAYAGVDDSHEVKEQSRRFMKSRPMEFVENKGQMTDANNQPAPYILFKFSSRGMNVFVTEHGLTYVFTKTEEKLNENDNDEASEGEVEEFETERAWINLSLKGATIKMENIEKLERGSAQFSYYFSHCPNGITGVYGYQKLIIKNIYSGIDWVLYNGNSTGLKYDFIIHPGADANQIKLIYESAEPLIIDNAGNIIIQTPLGSLSENAPISFVQETNEPVATIFNKKILDENNVEVTFGINSYSSNSTLVIDPQQVWGTFFSGTDDQGGATSMEADNNNNLFIVGYTNGLGTGFPLMDAGTYYDNTITSVYDLFILKFSSSGVLIWGTYYGGNGNERALYEFPFISIDAAGNLYITGQTTSTDFPTQDAGGYYDSTFTGLGGQYNSYIVKFDNSGNRLWATYFGDNGTGFPGGTFIISSTIDPFGNFFITGYTNSTTGFALQPSGSAYFQNTNNGAADIFISKFDNAGNLTWSTYYGGSSTDYAYAIISDNIGNIFITGYTMSSDFPVMNGGAYYDGIFGFNEDVIIAKFDNAGNRLWSTFFGGNVVGSERAISIGCDFNNNIFIYGYTNASDFPVYNAGTYFDSIMNSEDMFISKFDNAGNLLWSTFFGGPGSPISSWDFWEADGLTIDNCGNVYIAYDCSAAGEPLYDPGCGSYIDSTSSLMLAEFSNTGTLLWSTKIGEGVGAGPLRFVITTDNDNALYYAYEYNAPTSTVGIPFVPLPGAYFNTDPGPAITTNHQDFLMKFIPDPLTDSITSTNDSCGCVGSATVYSCGNGPFQYRWSNGQTTQSVTGLCAGTYSVIVSDNSCGGQDDTVSVVIVSLSSLNATVSSVPSACTMNTGSATVTPSGTPPFTYLWSPSGQVTQTATGLGAGSYAVLVTDSFGCSKSFHVDVLTLNAPNATVTSQTNPLCSGGTSGSATVSVTGGATPYSFAWSPGGGTNATATGLSAGTYIVLVTDSNGCTNSDTVAITDPAAITYSIFANSSNCNSADGSAIISVSGGMQPYTYLWSDSQTTDTAVGLAAGTYAVTITDSNGCTKTASTVVGSIGGPTADAGVNTTITIGQSATLSAAGGVTYAWNTGETTASISVSPTIDMQFCVTAYDANGCFDTACVRVYVIPEVIPCPTNADLSVPNAFSPNKDGNNDEFCLQGWNICITEFSVLIYDRWGNKVYESSDPDFCWDGVYKGKPLDAAVFVYVIKAKLNTDEEVIRKGNISLIR